MSSISQVLLFYPSFPFRTQRHMVLKGGTVTQAQHKHRVLGVQTQKSVRLFVCVLFQHDWIN